MNVLCTLSFVLVTLIDGYPLSLQPEELKPQELMELDNFNFTDLTPPYVLGHERDFEKTPKKLANIHMQFFSALTIGEGNTASASSGGHNLSLILNDELGDDATDNQAFFDGNKFKVTSNTTFVSHGWASSWEFCINSFVPKYMALKKDWQVVCIDWSHYAGVGGMLRGIFGGIYATQARQSLDVGWYLGKYLAKFVKDSKMDPEKIHLVGHSLGAHLVGTMARTFTEKFGGDKQVARVTGLDPAGPVFVRDGSGIKMHMIKPSDAVFVDIIHTCGSLNPYALLSKYPMRLGDLHALGHADFYPNGGDPPQAGCGTAAPCAHGRSWEYFVESIDKDKPNAFASLVCGAAAQDADDCAVCGNEAGRWSTLGAKACNEKCPSVVACQAHASIATKVKADYGTITPMGFYAKKPEARTKYFLNVKEGEKDWSLCCA